MFKDICVVIVGFALIMSVGAGIVRTVEQIACSEYAETTSRTTEFRFWSGCYVQHGDRLIPKDEYMFVELKEH